MSRVNVIGGGAAGMLAACRAAECGHDVTLLEQNEKLGKKLYITGKGRCNLTNASDMETVFSNVMSNRKFLYSAFDAFDNSRALDFFHANGLQTKVERGNRVFPVSDHSSDVIAALARALKDRHVEVLLHTKVTGLMTEPLIGEPAQEDGKKKKVQTARTTGVALAGGRTLSADAVIMATGGVSYPATGATGDGYRFAADSGHRLVEPAPSLVPLEAEEAWCKSLQGLSLRNCGVKLSDGGKTVYEDFGELLFTHFGVSGPVILSASAAVKPELWDLKPVLAIDLKPALDLETLDRRLLRDFEEQKNRQFKNALDRLFPAKLVPVMAKLSDIDLEKKVNEVSREERRQFAQLIKNLKLTVTGTRGFSEAIITRGGVSTKDVDPSTMQSKRVRGLYFCGEVLDVDAMTGGYNLQIAWSTGYLAGSSVQ